MRSLTITTANPSLRFCVFQGIASQCQCGVPEHTIAADPCGGCASTWLSGMESSRTSNKYDIVRKSLALLGALLQSYNMGPRHLSVACRCPENLVSFHGEIFETRSHQSAVVDSPLAETTR